jgi:hypothetical protein
MNICILGNSHSACLKNAWEELSLKFIDHHITFFVAPSNALESINLLNGELIPVSAKLEETLRITSGCAVVNLEFYDLFVICGLGLSIKPIPLNLSWSAGFTQAVIQDWYLKTLNIRLCKIIRRATLRPIIILPNPQRATLKSTIPKVSYTDALKPLIQLLNIENVSVFPQPNQTLLYNWYTQMEYTINSKRLINNQPHPDSDVSHMNSAFGKIWLDALLSKINTVLAK